MEKSLQLDIVTPDRIVLSEQVDYVGAPGVEGEFGVLPGHVPLLAALTIGCIGYAINGKKQCAFVSGGFAEVSDNKVTILAESSELADNIDVARAMEARRRAEERLSAKDGNISEERARAALQRAIMRINISQ
jgi:F-type H+-transporting ATPase subunit epsilon